MGFPKIPKSWRFPRVILWLFVFEFLVTVPGLAIYGIAAPNTYRTALWKDGAQNGFNSDPSQMMYAYANYRPIPKTPMVWTQFITNWNLVISVLALFILLVKTVLHIMHFFYPLLSLFVHAALTAFWAVSVYGQAGPDRSDPARPSSSPWYLSKSCNVATTRRNAQFCAQAKGAFAIAVIMLAIAAVQIVLALHALIFGSKKRDSQEAAAESDDKSSPDSDYSNDKSWELHHVPRTPVAAKTPYTPRTLAFNTLSAGK